MKVVSRPEVLPGGWREWTGGARLLLVSLAWVVAVASARCAPLFTAVISVDGGPIYAKGVNDLRKWEELFDDISLKELFPSYTPNSSVDAVVDLRGLKGFLSYNAGSKELRLRIPAIGLDKRFVGSTREESQEIMSDWLHGRNRASKVLGKGWLTDVLQGAVKYSPVDPVAGNPNSLMTRMVQTDYRLATAGPFLKFSDVPPGMPKPKNLFHLRAGYLGSFQAGPYYVNGFNFDFGGTINLPNPHRAVLVDWPFAMTFTEGSESLMTFPGAGFQYRVNDYWSLTTLLRGSAVGSLKVGALAFLYSADVASYVRLPVNNLTVGWGLQAGLNHTIDGIELDDYDVSYELKNYPVRTGLDVSGRLPFHLRRMPARWGVYGAYTHFFGSDLYMEDQGEVGIQLGLIKDQGQMSYDRVALDLGYVFGRNYDGASMNLTFSF